MKRKFLSLIMAVVLAVGLCFTALAADDDQVQGVSTGTPVVVLAQYAVHPEYSSYTYSFYVIQNTGGSTIDVTASSESFTADGRIAATGESRLYGLGPGCVSIIYNSFQTDELVTKASTSWKTESSAYQSVIQDLSYTMEPSEGGEIVSVTNNGSITAEFVEGFALFFLGGTLVDYNWAFFGGSDGKLNPGEMVEMELTSSVPFDSVQFYITGRGSR